MVIADFYMEYNLADCGLMLSSRGFVGGIPSRKSKHVVHMNTQLVVTQTEPSLEFVRINAEIVCGMPLSVPSDVKYSGDLRGSLIIPALSTIYCELF